MKKYYQPRGGKKGRFTLRENTYRRIWYLIADYPYYKAVQRGWSEAVKLSKGNRVAEPLFEYDVERAQCERYIKAIEDAMEKVPPAYVEYILSHIVERRQYKEMREVSERVLKMWVQRFIWYVAHNLGDA